MTDLTLVDGLTLGAAVAIIAFLWSLHRDVRSLAERIAKVEGLIEGLRDAITGRDREKGTA